VCNMSDTETTPVEREGARPKASAPLESARDGSVVRDKPRRSEHSVSRSHTSVSRVDMRRRVSRPGSTTRELTRGRSGTPIGRESRVSSRARDRDVNESDVMPEVSEYESESDEEDELSGNDMRWLLKSLATTVIDSKRHKMSEFMMREVQSLAAYRDTDEIHNYILGLEADLSDIEVPKKRWKRILLRKLTPKARKLVRGYVSETNCTYGELKTALIKKLGLHKSAVTDKLFGAVDRELRQMDPVARYQHLRDHMDRLVLSCTSMDELPLAVVVGIFRTTLSTPEKCLLDAKTIKS